MPNLGRATLLAALGCLALGACGTADDPTYGAAEQSPPQGAAAQVDTSPSPTPTPTPVATTENVPVSEPIPFGRVTRDDPTMAKGKTAITTPGVNGVRTLTFRVTFTDGRETGRTLITDRIKVPAVDEVTSVGTYEPPPPAPKPKPKSEQRAEPDPEPAGPARGCDSNYSGCVPIDSDVDCAGGSGNGPSYVQGPVNIVGSDPYKLDADNDGVGCES